MLHSVVQKYLFLDQQISFNHCYTINSESTAHKYSVVDKHNSESGEHIFPFKLVEMEWC